jgi:hypothetical protein
MKIKPTSKFITDQVVADGEAIVLVGTRLTESHIFRSKMVENRISA